MPGEINWERTGYQSRVDALADEISTFVETVLQTIDVERARASPARWEKVCRFFAGCARAARAQGNTPLAGGKRIADYLTEAFPCSSEGSDEGFFEFMDWLSKPNEFRPTRLHSHPWNPCPSVVQIRDRLPRVVEHRSREIGSG